MATGAVINRVRDFAQEVTSCGIALKKVFLFGSYAWNEQTGYSDIDAPRLRTRNPRVRRRLPYV